MGNIMVIKDTCVFQQFGNLSNTQPSHVFVLHCNNIFKYIVTQKVLTQDVVFAADLNKSETTALISAATLKHLQCFYELSHFSSL